MTFDIVEYVETLAARLSTLETRRRVAFSAHCSELLLEEVRSFLERMMDAQEVLALRHVLDEAWQQVDRASEPNALKIAEAQKICESSGWTEEDLKIGDEHLSHAAIECMISFMDLIDCMQSGSAGAAAATAEHLLNQVDSRLSSLGIADPLSDERFIAEVERQRRMLSYLESAESLSVDFRVSFRS